MSPDGKQGMRVKDFSKNKWMLWWDNIGDSSWVWEIYADGESQARLVTRVRVKYRWFSPAILFHLIIEFFDIVMMRKCMLGIKRRAEAMTCSKSLVKMKIEMSLPISLSGDVANPGKPRSRS
jgi:hypothetical protein